MTGFNNESVELTFGSLPLGACTAGASGACEDSETTPINLPAGIYSVTATGAQSGLTATTTFNQNAAILALLDLSGQAGRSKQASLLGFNSGEFVSLTFNGAPVGQCQTSASGNCIVNYQVPEASGRAATRSARKARRASTPPLRSR